LYTDPIACFCLLLGFVSYVHHRHLLSSIAFILAIASRQYLLAFPVAIAIYEFIFAMTQVKTLRSISWAAQRRWFAPLVASLSIFGWIYLFQGLAPHTGADIPAPAVQKTIWALTPGGSINFLAFVGTYIVIPEFILFPPQAKLQAIKQQWQKIVIIAVCLLLYVIVFPPLLKTNGHIVKIIHLLSHDILKIGAFYILALLACVRFTRPDLLSLMVLLNTLIMAKAYPWDKYVLPLAIVFWYLKSIRFESVSGYEKG
jgi:hypothetical protein